MEEVKKETLVAMLRDKAKELKKLESMKKKVEERYLTVFKENKNLRQDKETFDSFLYAVFPREDAEQLVMEESGMYQLDHLKNFYQLIKNKKVNENDDIVKLMQEEKKILQEKIKQLSDKTTENEQLRDDLEVKHSPIAPMRIAIYIATLLVATSAIIHFAGEPPMPQQP